MSTEQLCAFLETVLLDENLQKQLMEAQDIETAVLIAEEAGFDVSAADWLRQQAKETLVLSDEELLEIAGGASKGTKIGWGIGASIVSLLFFIK